MSKNYYCYYNSTINLVRQIELVNLLIIDISMLNVNIVSETSSLLFLKNQYSYGKEKGNQDFRFGYKCYIA
jgi:hypothetical protein